MKKVALSLSLSTLILGGGVLLASSLTQACSSTPPQNGFAELADAGDSDSEPPSLGTESGDDGGIQGEGCGGGEVVPTKVPVYFMLVVDGSGSMIGAKWDGQAEALKAVAEAVKKKTAAQIAAGELADTALGMLVFDDSLDPTNGSGPYPSTSDIPIQAVSDDTIMASFWGRVSGKADGSTPTKKALTGGYTALEMYMPQANVKPGGKRVAILLSDGQPSDDSPSGSIHAMATAKAAQAKPIYTYAIGVGNGSSYSPKFMADLAKAGRTAPSGCNTAATTNPDCFYQIDPSGGKSSTQISAEMVTALETIRALASECDLALSLIDKDGQPADPTRVEVTYVDGKGKETPVSKDPKDGWTYDDPTNPSRIILNGAACVQARSSAGGKTKVKMGCKNKQG